MSCTMSHECRVMLIAELLTASTDATRGWLRAEMDRTVDPMLDSIFNRLKSKLTNVQIHQPSTSTHFSPQFVNMNYSYQQQQQNVPNNLHSNSYPQLSSQSQPMTIKEEIEQTRTHQVQSCSYPPVSNEQSNYNLIDQNRNNDTDEDNENSEINLQNTEMQPQPLQFAHIKHNQFDDEECDCKGCVDGGIEVKEEDDEEDYVDEELSQTVKRLRMDRTQPNIAIGGATERTTSPIQPNLAQSNRHLQCPHCHKLCISISKLQTHLRVHTGERSFHCDQCDKRFSERGNLTKHQLIHQNRKRFQCDQCDKRFNLKKNLSQHQLIHQNIKSFRCHECDKHFTQKNHLDSHLLAHSGERPFACRHCAKSFKGLSARKTHEQAIHLHVKPYRCKQCGHTATQQSTIIRHIRVVHFGLPATMKEQNELNIIDHRDARELVEKV